ncbi:MAG TPA: MGMT family protein [Mycobacteriales bacterium]|nr:MGMT family protein [Mycobacteriales bacterium]
MAASRQAGSRPAALTAFAQSVLDTVDRIPAGKVMTYGDVAEYLGAGGPRAVGAVLRRYGREVCWWRVLPATGYPAPSHPAEALRHLVAEGVPLLAGGARVDLACCRWDGS